jgi:hypothetical protein
LRKLSILFLLAGLALVLAAALQQGGLGLSTDAFSNGSNAFTADTLNAPTGLTAIGGSSISLSWTATSDTYASGYHVLRSTTSGGSYTQIAQVTPRTTTTYVDSPGAGGYYYVVRAYYQNWESVNSNQAAAGDTGLANCTANAAVTTSSGDNNGFETSPGNECADDANSSQDVNSGTGTSTSCTSTAKDRHRFYNYGFSIPSGSVINGIRVRLDAWADSTTSSPHMCVELSWDGGTTWTSTPQQTGNLTTSQATYTLGSASDTWGRTWATGDFSNANFRVRITDVDSNFFGLRDYSLDWAAVEVTYTPP